MQQHLVVHVGSAGAAFGVATPNLDALAAESIHFDRAFAQATSFSPSLAAVLSGLYPTTNGLVNPGDRLQDAAVTLAETFATSFQQVQWVVLAYLLTITSLVVSVGRLGDVTGRRRLLTVGIIVLLGLMLMNVGAATLSPLATPTRGAVLPAEPGIDPPG